MGMGGVATQEIVETERALRLQDDIRRIKYISPSSSTINRLVELYTKRECLELPEQLRTAAKNLEAVADALDRINEEAVAAKRAKRRKRP